MILQLDLDRTRRNRIKLVGVELEGGWPPETSMTYFHRDGTVKGLGPHLLSGEKASPPLIPGGIGSWVLANYPNEINDTCGLHLHMSFFHDRHYKRCMAKDYQDTMIDALAQWANTKPVFHKDHHIWGRLNGESKFCQLHHWPDLQVGHDNHGDQASPDRFFKPGSRYTAINYCYGLEGGRGTFEVRVLPMMPSPSLTIGALELMVNVTNAYLFATREQTRHDRIVFDIPTDTSANGDNDDVIYI